jgi:hypothetical protein
MRKSREKKRSEAKRYNMRKQEKKVTIMKRQKKKE